MEYSHLKSVRLFELKKAIQIIFHYFPDRGKIRILEIGAGAGWQAKFLAEKGFEVSAIELENSNYSRVEDFPIKYYNGKNIPFQDAYFDVVFSSNVLEHIPHLSNFHGEMQRVLKPNGLAIHLMPSGTWVFWRTIVHYPAVLKMGLDMLLQKMKSKKVNQEDSVYGFVQDKYEQLSFMQKLRKAILPSRHGERGNALSEIYYFSKMEWWKIFKKGGWNIIDYQPNGLFYTGHLIFGRFLPLSTRNYLSYMLGSSCHVFVLKK